MKSSENIDTSPSKSYDLESYRRMFNEACIALGEVNEVLGLNPNDGGSGPIIVAIQALHQAVSLAKTTYGAEPVATMSVMNGAVIYGAAASARALPDGDYDLHAKLLHGSEAAVPAPEPVLFYSLPLGSRFSYEPGGYVWVILDRHGTGRIAKWDGLIEDYVGQTVASAENTEEATRALMVYVREDDVPKSSP